MSILFPLTALVKKELVVTIRNPIDLLNPLFFFLLITVLFPLAVTSDPNKLMLMGPGVIWIALLFANMLSLEQLFTNDYEEGVLEQMVLSTCPLYLQVLVKVTFHWIFLLVPLILMSFLISKFYFIPKQGLIALILSLLLGSPVLCLIGAIGSALTLGLKNKGILLIMLVLPLYLPVLIFGAGAANDAIMNLPFISHLAFLGAFLALSLTFAPLAVASALKVALE